MLVRTLEASPVKDVLACFQLDVLRPCALCQLHYLCSRCRSIESYRLTHPLHHVLLHVWQLQSLAGCHSPGFALGVPGSLRCFRDATSCCYERIYQRGLFVCQLLRCYVHFMCLGLWPSGSYPLPSPHCYRRQNAVSTHIGLTASACAVAYAAGCAGRLGRRCLPAIVPYHRATIPCGAVPLRPLGPHNTYPHGSAGPTIVGLRCLTTNALHPPAPSLCGMGSRRDRAGQPPDHTLIRAVSCALVASCSPRGRPRPRCGRKWSSPKARCAFELEGAVRPWS